jgi:hypothetical protein
MDRLDTGRMHFPRRLTMAAAALVGLLLAGCSGGMPGMSSLSSMFKGGSKPAADASASAVALPPDFECPSVAIRQGASTMTFSANPAEPSATNLRYQVGFGNNARECRLQPGNMVSMRVGVEGRVILGPAGAPGQFDVPVRFAIVHEGVEPKTIVTRLHRIAVTVPPDSTSVMFTHIEEDLAFPMPRGNAIDSYVVYIGFDPVGAQEMDRRRPPARPARPRASADAPAGPAAGRRAPL